MITLKAYKEKHDWPNLDYPTRHYLEAKWRLGKATEQNEKDWKAYRDHMAKNPNAEFDGPSGAEISGITQYRLQQARQAICRAQTEMGVLPTGL